MKDGSLIASLRQDVTGCVALTKSGSPHRTELVVRAYDADLLRHDR